MRGTRPVKRAGGCKAFVRFFDLGLMAGSQPDDFACLCVAARRQAEDLFVDLAEYVRHRLTAHG